MNQVYSQLYRATKLRYNGRPSLAAVYPWEIYSDINNNLHSL